MSYLPGLYAVQPASIVDCILKYLIVNVNMGPLSLLTVLTVSLWNEAINQKLK